MLNAVTRLNLLLDGHSTKDVDAFEKRTDEHIDRVIENAKVLAEFFPDDLFVTGVNDE